MLPHISGLYECDASETARLTRNRPSSIECMHAKWQIFAKMRALVDFVIQIQLLVQGVPATRGITFC